MARVSNTDSPCLSVQWVDSADRDFFGNFGKGPLGLSDSEN